MPINSIYSPYPGLASYHSIDLVSRVLANEAHSLARFGISGKAALHAASRIYRRRYLSRNSESYYSSWDRLTRQPAAKVTRSQRRKLLRRIARATKSVDFLEGIVDLCSLQCVQSQIANLRNALPVPLRYNGQINHPEPIDVYTGLIIAQTWNNDLIATRYRHVDGKLLTGKGFHCDWNYQRTGKIEYVRPYRAGAAFANLDRIQKDIIKQRIWETEIAPKYEVVVVDDPDEIPF